MFHFDWTDDAVTLLKQLWKDGLSCSRIADELGGGLSRNAVIGKVARLGLEKRRTVTRAYPPKPRVQTRRLQTFSTKRAGDLRHVKTEAKVVNDQDIPQEQRRTLLELTAHTCRWPVGDPGNADFFFCGAEPLPGCPYCLAHCRKAYNRSYRVFDPGALEVLRRQRRLREVERILGENAA